MDAEINALKRRRRDDRHGYAGLNEGYAFAEQPALSGERPAGRARRHRRVPAAAGAGSPVRDCLNDHQAWAGMIRPGLLITLWRAASSFPPLG